MGDAWDDRKRVKEDEFFQRQSREATAKLKETKNPRTDACPRDGEKLSVQTFRDVTIERCPKCGGIWLDSGEVDQIIRKVGSDAQVKQEGGIVALLKGLFGKS
jgi:uncharacterized protein